jgi:transcriptional regulator with XRE-family HTH domain
MSLNDAMWDVKGEALGLSGTIATDDDFRLAGGTVFLGEPENVPIPYAWTGGGTVVVTSVRPATPTDVEAWEKRETFETDVAFGRTLVVGHGRSRARTWPEARLFAEVGRAEHLIPWRSFLVFLQQHYPAPQTSEPDIEFRRAGVHYLVEVIPSRAAAISEHAVAPSLPEPDPKPYKSKAFGYFRELAEWLQLTDEETADVLGVGRTTPYAWESGEREPQPANARKLYQIHNLVSSIFSTAGDTGTVAWLESGTPTARELLLAGQIEEATTKARELIFAENIEQPRFGAVVEGQQQPRISSPDESKPLKPIKLGSSQAG